MSSLEAYESRFDAGGWLVFKRTIEASRKQGEHHIFSEHVIRQLFAEDEDLFKDILENLGVESETFRIVIEKRIRSRPQHIDGRIRLDVEVIEMLKGALGRARAQGRLKISKADMLVALAQDEVGALLEIFRGMGIDPVTVVNEIRAAVEIEPDQSTTPILEQGAQPFCRKGDTIRIRKGAFTAMSAKVDKVDYERSRLRVNVNIYGRSNVIELSFSDVEKVSFD